jgi:hypothetical protein
LNASAISRHCLLERAADIGDTTMRLRAVTPRKVRGVNSRAMKVSPYLVVLSHVAI